MTRTRPAGGAQPGRRPGEHRTFGFRLGGRLLAVLLAAGAVLAVVSMLGGGAPPSFGPGAIDPDAEDPFAWSDEREGDLARRAAAGHSHVVYAKSPGGARASATRTARWRPLVEDAAADAGVAPDVLEGVILLESAGRPDATAGDDLEGAVGLTQILAETGRNLLGLRVDVQASERLTKRLRRASGARARRLRGQRARVDERFDPRKALAATGRYLSIARKRFGRADLAVVSYHMGIGNLEGVIDAYAEEDAEDLSYTRLFFDLTPDTHPRAYRRLSRLGDDSSTYWWRVLASREIMRLHRSDPARLSRLASLHTSKNSAEEVLHPPDRTESFADADQLEEAYDAGELRPLPNAPRRVGLRRDARMGELAGRLDREPRLYRGLRPGAYALAAYTAARVRAIARTRAPLILTSTVRDRGYQRLLTRRNVEATRNFSLHTTGWAFDVRRLYASRRQAVAFQFMLDRLQALNLIAWVREPGAIHVTASPESERLLSLLDS